MAYQDEEMPLWAEFLCGFVGGTIGAYNFPGWLLVYFGWLSPTTALLLCAGVGFTLGSWLAWEQAKDRRK